MKHHDCIGETGDICAGCERAAEARRETTHRAGDHDLEMDARAANDFYDRDR